MPVHWLTGCGGFQRNSPIGGAAYGTPRKATSLSEPKYVPSSTPVSNVTFGGGGEPKAIGAWPKPSTANAIRPVRWRQHAAVSNRRFFDSFTALTALLPRVLAFENRCPRHTVILRFFPGLFDFIQGDADYADSVEHRFSLWTATWSIKLSQT